MVNNVPAVPQPNPQYSHQAQEEAATKALREQASQLQKNAERLARQAKEQRERERAAAIARHAGENGQRF